MRYRHKFALRAALMTTVLNVSPAQAFDGLDDLDVRHSVKSTATGFRSDAADGQENNAYEASLLYSAETDLYLSDTLSMVVSGYVHEASHTDISGVFVGPNEDESRSPYGDLIELGLRWDGDYTTVKLGKWKQNYEFADRMTLLNRYNLGDYTVPMNNVNTGNWLAQVQQFFDSGNLNLTVMPYHPATGQPADDSRWGGVNSNGTLLPDQTSGRTIYSDKPDISLIWEGTADRFDYMLGASRAQSLYSVSKINIATNSLQTEYPYASSLFGGISYPLDGARLYMEAYYQNTDDGRDDDFVRMTTGMNMNFYNYAESIGLEDLNASLEFLTDHTIREQSNPGYRVPSSMTRPFQNALYAVVSAKLTNEWSVAQEFSRGFSKRDALSITKLTYSFDDSTEMAMQYTAFHGTPDVSLFGNWKHNDNLTLTFTKDF